MACGSFALSFAPMNILVTGGAGYIGSVAVDALLAAGHRVAVLDNFYQGHRDAVNPEAAFFECDLADKEGVRRVVAEVAPDSIMHFAAYTLVGDSVENPFKYLGESVQNAINLISAAIDGGVQRFIFSSTANLFDEPARIPIAADELIVPGSPYGESKYFVERILHWAHRTKGLRYACLRYFNAAGCTATKGEDHDPETHLIPIVIQVALGQRASIKIFGDDYPTPDGTCVRDYIHVVDLAQAHIRAMRLLANPDSAIHQHYNLGNGRGFSIREVVESARRVTGHPIPTSIGPRRAGDPALLIASSEAANQDLGWTPRFTELDDIMRSAWEWHRTHPHGYQE